MDEGIDTGDIILQRTFPISDDDNYKSLLEKAYIECANILYEAVELFKYGPVKGIKQVDIHPVSSYCAQRKEGDEFLDWKQSSRDIFNFVRAICKPGPMTRTFLNGKEMKINRVKYIKDAPVYKGIPSVILRKDKNGFLVKTGDSYIKVLEWEYDGSIKVGDRFHGK